MKLYNSILLLLCTVVFFSSCEDPIDLELDEGKSQLVVDAFISDSPGQQLIYLNKTTSYFDNTSSVTVSGATVSVSDDQGNQYLFQDQGDGVYAWGSSTDIMVTTGNKYTLSVTAEGEEFKAESMANPVPTMDSLSYEFREEDPFFGLDEGYFAWFNAIDIPGREDFYWIRVWRNDTLQRDPSRIIVSTDGAFTGNGADGFFFILPIRESINDFDRPYTLGESVKVELRSIDNLTFDYLLDIQTQMNNADNGLFAVTPENVNSNIKNVNTNSSVKALGWFSVSSVQRAETIIEE